MYRNKKNLLLSFFGEKLNFNRFFGEKRLFIWRIWRLQFKDRKSVYQSIKLAFDEYQLILGVNIHNYNINILVL